MRKKRALPNYRRRMLRLLVNDLFRLGNADGAAYVVLAGRADLTVSTWGVQPDKMSNDESSGDQEGADEGTSAGFHGDGHPSL